MPTRTPTEDKAIAWFCQTYNLVPQLSTHPTYYFKSKATGETNSRNIIHIVKDYKKYLEQDKQKGNQ